MTLNARPLRTWLPSSAVPAVDRLATFQVSSVPCPFTLLNLITVIISIYGVRNKVSETGHRLVVLQLFQHGRGLCVELIFISVIVFGVVVARHPCRNFNFAARGRHFAAFQLYFTTKFKSLFRL